MTESLRPLPVPRFNPAHADLERWFGPLEAAILVALWDADRPQTTKAVWRALQRDYSATIAYTTVMTTLGRLWEKAVIDRAKREWSYCYVTRETRAQFESRQVDAILLSLEITV